MRRSNPLDMPEIVTMVGRCLPLWKHSERLGFYDFNPTVLLKCCLVNKTWYNALMPVIWYIYNGFVMRLIPKEIIIKNSRYFRVFFHDRSFAGPFECKHLRALEINWWDTSLLPLVRDNTGSLENLIWKGLTTTRSALPVLDYNILMQMTGTLVELQLSHWTISGNKLIEFLGACKTLGRLFLTTIEWVEPAQEQYTAGASSPSSSPLLTSLQSTSNTGISITDSIYHQGTCKGLSELRLDISSSREGAFLDLVRSCPDLQIFSLYSENTDDPRMLIPILKNYCLKLSSIEYVLRSSALGGYEYMSDPEYSDFILSARHLKQLKIDIPWLDNAMTSALIMQSSTLESLTLRFQKRRAIPMKDAENICKILKHCCRLKNIVLIFNPHSLGRDETLKLFEEPWKCLELETLDLTDVTMSMDNFTAHGDQNQPLQPYHWRLASAPRSIPDSGNNGSGQYGSLARQKLFDQVRRLPRLSKLSLNHTTYTVSNITKE
ncbi:hypothetical protein BGZ76_005423 [Entomortierella beljakovae]|nr:hypothetical protein BGZ76_005423 [Entomortierella beljakovae]